MSVRDVSGDMGGSGVVNVLSKSIGAVSDGRGTSESNGTADGNDTVVGTDGDSDDDGAATACVLSSSAEDEGTMVVLSPTNAAEIFFFSLPR